MADKRCKHGFKNPERTCTDCIERAKRKSVSRAPIPPAPITAKKEE